MCGVSPPARPGLGAHRAPALIDGVVGAVMVGGRSSRFGTDKSLVPVGDTVLGAIAVAALREAGIDPVVAVGGTAGHRLNVITVPDHWPGEGPLAALATVLRWARRGRVLMVPCDLPLLTVDPLATLIEVGDSLGPTRRDQTAVVATVAGEPRYSVALWPATWASPMRQLVEGGERRFRAALDVGEWIGTEVDGRCLADADSPAELEQLLDGR